MSPKRTGMHFLFCFVDLALIAPNIRWIRRFSAAAQHLIMVHFNLSPLNLRCYVVIEVKINEFDSENVGQLGTYISAVNHILKRPEDNPTIGLLICKTKDNVLAQYALEASNQPIGISEYELTKLYPKDFKGTLPSIKELENELKAIKN